MGIQENTAPVINAQSKLPQDFPNLDFNIAQESGQCQERGHPPASFHWGTIPQGDGRRHPR